MQKNIEKCFKIKFSIQKKKHKRTPNLIACAHKNKQISQFKIKTKTRYNLDKTIRKFWIPLEQQSSKSIKGFPTTNHVMHFPTKNHTE